MPLVINSLGQGHTHASTHTDDPHRINFKKPGARHPQAGTPGLKLYIVQCYFSGFEAIC